MPKAKTVGAANRKDVLGGEIVAWENPLIPNKRLRALYAAMVELRLLDENVGKQAKTSGHAETMRGDEGCLVSTTFDLKPGDLTSDRSRGATTTRFLRGAKLASLVHRSPVSGSGKPAASEDDATGQLPVMSNPLDRLHLAMGASFVLKTARKRALLIAYVSCDEVTLTEWKPLLRFAAQHALPMIFVVLPQAPENKRATRPGGPGQLSLASSKCGVPGIPVDAADPVALYRVAQESMLRARAGGGPVLMECIAFRVVGQKAMHADPIATMQEFLLHRRIVDRDWLQGVEVRFKARLEAAQR